MIRMTETAEKKLREMLEKSQETMVRIFVGGFG